MSDRTSSKMEVKVYLVLDRRRLVPDGEPNVSVIAARLTNAAAEKITAKRPGTFILKVVAIK